MNKLRISYSTITAWKRYSKEEFVKYYFKIREEETTVAQEEGTTFDKLVSDYVVKNKKMPSYLPAVPFVKPIEHPKWVAPYNDKIDLVGVPDIVDEEGSLIVELKSGSSMDSADYSNTIQLPMYFFIASLLGKNFKSGYIVHYDQAIRKGDMSLMWNTEYTESKVKEVIDTTGMEIFDYMNKEGLL